ncbi:hypothetical protein AQULUS_13320 [Aquicella lusitana]|uniref:Uncharacterized protein n=1 Tax=Aquicella lusitana TaxID=254246 RepID=A0A370GJL1_9COXI|nr:hypothetical protein C8D86_11195 [Aquicella lusitana]VVC73589.1 hypothetical protein AQULUS_13320 [Aquicella lusitana]
MAYRVTEQAFLLLRSLGCGFKLLQKEVRLRYNFMILVSGEVLDVLVLILFKEQC